MTNSKKTGKNSYPRIPLLIALSFAIGFGLATISAMTIFCPECFGVTPIDEGNEKTGPILNDPRIIAENVEDLPSPVKEIFTPIGIEKKDFLEDLVSDPRIQLALKNSNERDSKMSEDIRKQIYRIYEKEWTQAQENTPFMESIINNDVSQFLLSNHVIQSDKFGYLSFGEHILTNGYGPNVAVSIKTDNYDQGNDDWWQISFRDEEGKPFARECEFDESAGIFSEDIVIKITDTETGEFIGILNSATPCNVTKDSLLKTKIIPVSLDNITPEGESKISYLNELVKNPIIQNALKLSNEKFSSLTDSDLVLLKEKTYWPIPGKEEPNSLQVSILENQVSDLLRQNLVVPSDDFVEFQFPEMILTNSKGINVASTERTFNYIQNQDEWWQVAFEKDGLIRHCGKDISINMSSEDIIIKIFNHRGEFIGILNAATPCDVVLVKPPNFYGDSN